MSTHLAVVTPTTLPQRPDALDMRPEIELGRRMVADAVARYESAVKLWAGLTLEQQLVAGRDFGLKAPTAHEVLQCLDVVGRLQSRYATVEGRDSVAVESLLNFMGQVRALVAQHVPDEQGQRALLGAIQDLDVR